LPGSIPNGPEPSGPPVAGAGRSKDRVPVRSRRQADERNRTADPFITS
jgi:hypothetical protein